MTFNPLITICFRESVHHPLRTLLLIFGIALGVSGVVAIDIARSSVSKSFELSSQVLTSRATHQVVGTRFEIPQSIFAQIRTRLGIEKSAPIITTHVRVKEMDNQTLTFMGIDPFSEIHFRDLTTSLPDPDSGNFFSGLLSSSSGVLVSKEVAEQYGLSLNTPLTFLFGLHAVQTHVAGFLVGRETNTRLAFKGLILADISLAQEILGMTDQITRIDLFLETDIQAEQVKKLLPDGVVLVSSREQDRVVRELSRSFETSLAAFSMLALFMGIFLIYNTISFSVARQRKLNGILRALGATRIKIFSALISEVMIYALAGSILGLILGILLGKGAVQAVCATVSDMYFVLTVNQTQITAATLLKGIAAGLFSSFIASLFPALTAAKTVPVTLMQSSVPESLLKRYLPGITLAGGVIVSGALAALFFAASQPAIDFLWVFLIFFGASLLCPLCIVLFTRVVSRLFRHTAGGMVKMALGNITRSLSRTSVLIASLMVAASVYIGIDIMTGSFRASIAEWIDGHIGGDIHVSSQDTLSRSLDPSFMARIRDLPEVASVSSYNIHRIFSRLSGEVHLFSYESDLSTKRWAWTAAEETALPGLLEQGWIFVSEIFAQQNGVSGARGASVALETQKGPVVFNVAGIFRDYFMGGGRVVVSRSTMKHFWGHGDITAMQIFLDKGRNAAPVMDKITGFIPASAMIKVVSGAAIKADILEVFDQTFIITSALQILTALVALTGILNSVMALILERSRELGILRACGAEKRQLGTLLLIECGFSGLISGLLALPLGICLAWILIDMINRRAFGWTYDMAFSPVLLVQAVLLSTLAAVAAGIVPAIRAGKIDIGKALRME